jgi:alpha,alpha-trehalase
MVGQELSPARQVDTIFYRISCSMPLLSIITDSGSELSWVDPDDFLPIDSKTDDDLDGHESIVHDWVRWIHERWALLTRSYNPNMVCSLCTSSLLPIPEPFVVPGGRFVESYYWDTYWILRGLMVSGMSDTVEGVFVCIALDQT